MEQIIINALSKAAKENQVELATLLAVKQVETGSGLGLNSNNTPKILFEGHIFYKLLSEKYGQEMADKWNKSRPKIVYQKWTKTHYLGGIDEYKRLKSATGIDEELALQSASWGLFQIMGFNWKLAGCSSVKDFVNKNYSTEYQLQLGINYINNRNLMPLLRGKNWAGFARAYNGPSYKANAYDQKLRNAYKNFKKVYKD